jgi:glycosyltransferase involved in cell wall biosynthesis
MPEHGTPSERIEVGLDITSAVTGQAGLRRYAQELWRELERRDDLRVRAFALGRGSEETFEHPARRLHIPLRLLRPLWLYLRWPRAESFVGSVDVVHSLALTTVPSRLPRVATVHDVLPLIHPGLYPPGVDRTQRRELTSAAQADVIVATCEATADEIARVAPFPRERIVVAPLGVTPLPSRNGGSAPEDRYLLAVSAMTPRKGLDVLARAVARLGPDCPRVLIAGPDYWGADVQKRAIAEADRYGKIELLGAVEDGALGALYEGATAVCYPSRAEGFGLPCLEAMAAGAPLIASDLAPVREVVGDAAELVPPEDPEALAGAIAKLLADVDLRESRVEAGRRRASRFTWQRTATEVVRAYRTALVQ